MKKTMTYLLLLAGILLLAGCQKEGRISGGKGEIRFVASARPDTKTEYGSYYKPDPNDDEKWVDANPADATWQSIDWVDGNRIRIYSDNAVRRVGFESGDAADALYHWADYSVTGSQKGTGNDIDHWSSATLINLSNDGSGDPYDQEKVGDAYHVGNGLMWGNSNHAKFYAIYPAPTAAEASGSGIDGVGGTLACSIPASQSADVDTNMGNDGVGGNIGFAFMTAFGEADKPTSDNPTNVKLKFEPAFTAFEFSIRSAAEPIALESFKLVSDNAQALCGPFTVSYTNGTRSFAYASATGKEISVDLTGRSAPQGSDLTFTVFALPQDYSKLHIEFKKVSGETLKLALREADTVDEETGETTTGDYITFGKCKKHRIYGLILPYGELLISVGTAQWLAGGEFSFTTIEDVETFFVNYRRYNAENPGSDSWSGHNYVAISYGIDPNEEVNIGTEEAPNMVKTNRPLYSPMITLTTVSTGTDLLLKSSNNKIGFVTANENGVFSTTPVSQITIPSCTPENPVVTTYFVVPTSTCPAGETTDIMLIREDLGTPIAWSHFDMPGSTDHTKVHYIVLSEDDYNDDNKTFLQVPSI